MGPYLAKLAVMLPLLGLLIWGSLRLTRQMQQRLAGAGAGRAGRRARVVETSFLSPGIRLAVIEFHGREILVAATRQGLTRLGEAGQAELGQ